MYGARRDEGRKQQAKATYDGLGQEIVEREDGEAKLKGFNDIEEAKKRSRELQKLADNDAAIFAPPGESASGRSKKPPLFFLKAYGGASLRHSGVDKESAAEESFNRAAGEVGGGKMKEHDEAGENKEEEAAGEGVRREREECLCRAAGGWEGRVQQEAGSGGAGRGLERGGEEVR